MSDNTIHCLAILGFTFAILIIGSLILILLVMLKEAARKIKRKYCYKHRFKKKPLAKCYCIDCFHYFKNDGSCSLRGTVPEDWFCKEAEPYL